MFPLKLQENITVWQPGMKLKQNAHSVRWEFEVNNCEWQESLQLISQGKALGSLLQAR